MTLCRLAPASVLVVLAMASSAMAQAVDARYQTPPEEIVKILDAAPPPVVTVSPARDRVAVVERASMPPIAAANGNSAFLRSESSPT